MIPHATVLILATLSHVTNLSPADRRNRTFGVRIKPDPTRSDRFFHDNPLIHLMNIRPALLSFASFLALASAQAREPQAPCLLRHGDVVAIVGDSITEQKLYSKFIETYLLASSEVSDLTCYQLGWGGETASGFLGRMDNDLMTLKPTVVTLCYGMNDGHYVAYEPSIGKGYGDPLTKVVTKLKGVGTRVVVGSPGVVDSNSFKKIDPAVYNDNLGHLRDIAHQIA
ncbi:MAG: hypothetical protein JWO89_586, partial [Verrucomicrobiaceae bacterium]|nr:hypothetical protein [Verrucomicrobiaceae bacterium]